MKLMLQRVGLLAICSGVALLAAGCWDNQPIDQMAIVLSLGIDAGDVPNTMKVTFEIMKPGGGIGGSEQGGGGGSEQATFLVTASGRTLMEALQSAQHRISRRMFLSQLQNVIFGAEYARQGLGPSLDHLQRSGELRRTMSVVVAKEGALKALSSQPDLSPLRGLVIDRLATQSFRTGGFDVIFGDFLESLVSPGAAAVALAVDTSSEGAKLMLSGLAAFQGDRLVGFFDQKESLGLSLALGRAQAQTVLIGKGDAKQGEFFVSFSLQHLNSKITPRLVDGKIEATISVEVDSFLFEQTGGPNLTTPTGYAELERMQEETVREAVEAAIKRAQEWQTDVFMLGDMVERRFPKEWKTLEKDWPVAFASVEFDVQVKGRVTETGLTRMPLPFEKGRSQ